jgi:opacity protein-like surface antigen
MNFLKRLALYLIVAMAISTAANAVENIKTGGVIESRGWWWASDNAPDSKYMESEINLWLNADLADNVFARINLKYKNDFGTGPGSDAATDGNIDLWEGYVLISKPFGLPLQARAGRWTTQIKPAGSINYVPKFGEGFMIPNNHPWDGFSGTLFFTPDKDNYTDMFTIKLREGSRGSEDDIDAFGMYFVTKAFECTQIDAYGAYIDRQNIPVSGTPIILPYRHIYVAGTRVAGSVLCNEKLSYKAELAYTKQESGSDALERDGIGGYVGMNYDFKTQYEPSVRLAGYYLQSGFEQPVGHVDQDDLFEKGYGRIADNMSNLTSNIWFITAGATVKPTDKLTVDLDAYYYRQANSTLVGNEKLDTLGTEVDLALSYTYTENVMAELVGGYFCPEDEGLSATRGTPSDDSWMLRGGVKVSF